MEVKSTFKTKGICVHCERRVCLQSTHSTRRRPGFDTPRIESQSTLAHYGGHRAAARYPCSSVRELMLNFNGSNGSQHYRQADIALSLIWLIILHFLSEDVSNSTPPPSPINPSKSLHIESLQLRLLWPPCQIRTHIKHGATNNELCGNSTR